MRAPEAAPLFGRSARRLHCLGVGGMGVAPLAIYLRQSGYAVSGEDDALAPEVAELLAREGVAVGALPDDCDLVIHSSAIPAAHPVYAAARARGLPVVRRGEALAEIARGLRLVAVCGAHGKTTTTAMLALALRAAGFPAGYLVGGLFGDGASPARRGSNDWLVAEIDESDGTIDGFSPEITLAVNLDWDHPDRYRRPEELEATYAALFRRTLGTVLVSDACPRSLQLAPAFVTFGRTGDFSFALAREQGDCQELRLGGRFAAVSAAVRARGDFNAANAAAALAAAQLMGAAVPARALAGYPGIRRRQGLLPAEGITVVEDYAHHPAEIRALLPSLRRPLAGGGALIAVFQPHRFSRTAQFKAEFAAALALADRVHLLDVYAAGEGPIAGGTSADIYAELKRGAPALPVSYLPGADADFFRALSRDVRPGDTVAFIGAGDIDRKARAWLEARRAELGRSRRWDELAEALRRPLPAGAVVRREEPLGPRTTLRVGGAARVYAEPAGPPELQAVLQGAARAQAPVFMLGRGSNLIVPDEGVDGVVITLAGPAWSKFEARPEGRIWVGAGLRLKNLCGLAARAGFAGCEFLEGIPGTVGGSLRMNAGAMGGCMFDLVDEVEVMSLDGEIRTLRRAEMHVDYRHCAELHHAIALGALLRPPAQAESAAIGRQLDVYRRKRQESQPREPSAGCIFKNPPGGSAGRLIDESGLKGERVGDAEVSPVHANFIVNRGHATGAEVLELVRRVRARVRQAKGVDLEPEVLLYGRDWRDVL
ncbi:MAG TPA: UDP-N-acetylmuramate dehydrogenase [Opitutaceae bacterium]|jgi:UDP-N-acetylmuramate--L-alanine ligase/UDP-N-acetylenolpyruvoylglucosamine reductase|nr:UDP-N-acetylmuramate dehydrogenase [Opitutaceae bacterium]